MAQSTHDIIERKVGLLIVLTLLTVSVGGLVEIVPLFFQKSTTTPVEGLKPYDPSAGRSRHLRPRRLLQLPLADDPPFRAETERYGHYSVAGEYVYDHPFQWGSKRTGPDLHRVGGRYSDQWQRAHLMNPRDVVPESTCRPLLSWQRPRLGYGWCRHREEDEVMRSLHNARGFRLPMRKSRVPRLPSATRPKWMF
jgi:cytochrome c oxidase cbb3-type subunit 2